MINFIACCIISHMEFFKYKLIAHNYQQKATYTYIYIYGNIAKTRLLLLYVGIRQ